jgi:predicted TPR repeat methyltransferase
VGDTKTDLERALALHEAGDLDAAEAAYRGLLERRADDADATHFLGVLLRQRGRAADGLALIERSVTLEPARAKFRYHLGNALDADGRCEEAAAAYRRAIELQPRYPLAQMNLGVVLQTLGRTEEAIETLERLVDLVPGAPAARFNLARAYESVGRQADAIAQLRAAVAAKRSVETLHWLGSQLRRYGDAEESVSVNQQAADLAAGTPAEADAWVELGQSQAAAGGTDEAAAAYRRALTVDPSHGRAAFFLATVRGDTPAASPREFIAEMYDGYADHFDRHLRGVLKYRTPEVLVGLWAAFRTELPVPPPLSDVCDAGCGTGLCGPLLAPFAKSLVGIDLSANMLRQAGLRKVYTELVAGDLVEELFRRPGAFDLVVAADVLIHLGDLDPVLAAVAGALRPGGVFLLSVEAWEGEGYVLLPTKRFAHAAGYVEAGAAAHGFAVGRRETGPLRLERGEAVVGHAYLLTR